MMLLKLSLSCCVIELEDFCLVASEITANRYMPINYTVSQKNKQNYFCYNYVKLPPNPTIFGTKMTNCSISSLTCLTTTVH